MAQIVAWPAAYATPDLEWNNEIMDDNPQPQNVTIRDIFNLELQYMPFPDSVGQQGQLALAAPRGFYSPEVNGVYLIVELTNRGETADTVMGWKLTHNIVQPPVPALPPSAPSEQAAICGIRCMWPEPVRIPGENGFVRGFLFIPDPRNDIGNAFEGLEDHEKIFVDVSLQLAGAGSISTKVEVWNMGWSMLLPGLGQELTAQ